MSDQPDLFGDAFHEESTEMTKEKIAFLIRRQNTVSVDEAKAFILEQRKFRDDCMVELVAPKEGEFDPFADDEATQAAIARTAARRQGAKFGTDGPGFQAFTPVIKTANEMVQEWSQHGDAEKTGGKAKRKTVNDRPLIEAFLAMIWPEAIEIRYEETWQTGYSGMRFKVDRDGFIDFSIQFNDRAEIAIQATTLGAESDHMKKMSTRRRKAGDNVYRWLKSGRKLYMVLCDDAPGKKGERFSWIKVGRYHRVATFYEITEEMLQVKRDKLAKLEANRIENKRKNR